MARCTRSPDSAGLGSVNQEGLWFALPLRSISAMNDQALEHYRKACGMHVPLVLECEGPSRSAAAAFRRSFNCPFVLIGRDPRSDLALEDKALSRRHAFIQAIAGRLLVIDLQSRTKVYWDGDETPKERGWLDPGQFVQIGPYRIRRAEGDASENQDGGIPALMAPPDHERPEAGPFPRAVLELPIRTSDGPSLWPIEGEFALAGGSDDCQLVLTDESVSRQHALVPTRLGVWVVDLLTREGVYVNSERVRWAWLADGDTLRIGRFTFILRYEIPPDLVTRQDIPLEAGAIPAERPGTELAVPVEHSHAAPNALVARPTNQSHMAMKAAAAAPSFEPHTLAPFDREAWESSMAYPLNPMTMWRQQMQLMEMFHNDMILMVQMFAAMHRQQMDSVRHEMDMVQRLTGQLQDLQTKLAEPSSHAEPGLTTTHVRPTEPHAPVPAPDQKKREKKAAAPEPKNVANKPEPASPPRAGSPKPERPKTRTAHEATPPPGPQGIGHNDQSQVLGAPHPTDLGTSARATRLLAKDPQRTP